MFHIHAAFMPSECRKTAKGLRTQSYSQWSKNLASVIASCHTNI